MAPPRRLPSVFMVAVMVVLVCGFMPNLAHGMSFLRSLVGSDGPKREMTYPAKLIGHLEAFQKVVLNIIARRLADPRPTHEEDEDIARLTDVNKYGVHKLVKDRINNAAKGNVQVILSVIGFDSKVDEIEHNFLFLGLEAAALRNKLLAPLGPLKEYFEGISPPFTAFSSNVVTNVNLESLTHVVSQVENLMKLFTTYRWEHALTPKRLHALLKNKKQPSPYAGRVTLLSSQDDHNFRDGRNLLTDIAVELRGLIREASATVSENGVAWGKFQTELQKQVSAVNTLMTELRLKIDTESSSPLLTLVDHEWARKAFIDTKVMLQNRLDVKADSKTFEQFEIFVQTAKNMLNAAIAFGDLENIVNRDGSVSAVQLERFAESSVAKLKQVETIVQGLKTMLPSVASGQGELDAYVALAERLSTEAIETLQPDQPPTEKAGIFGGVFSRR